eukprot:493163-Rhodomonas_salina.1
MSACMFSPPTQRQSKRPLPCTRHCTAPLCLVGRPLSQSQRPRRWVHGRPATRTAQACTRSQH